MSSPFTQLPKLPHSKGLRKKARKMKGAPKRPKGGFIKVGEPIQTRRERCTSGAGGSLPERLTRFALDKMQIPYTEQQSFRGGNANFAVLDFLLIVGTRQIALRVMSYWHTELERVAWDMVQKSRLHARGIDVVDIEELDLYAAADVGCGEVIKLVRRAVYGA